MQQTRASAGAAQEESTAPQHGPDDRHYQPQRIYPTRNPRLWWTTHVCDEQTADEIVRFPKIFFFSSCIPETYQSFCLDNGPIDVASLVQFCRDIQQRLAHPALVLRPLVFYTYAESTSITNTAMLLCSYLVLCEGYTPEEAWWDFSCIENLPLDDYHDATFSKQTFKLTVLDVLHGLDRAKTLGWLDVDSFDVAEWQALHEKSTHDINIMSPDFVAMSSPKDQPDEYTDARPVTGYVVKLVDLGVTDLVRFNNRLYDEDVVTSHGITVHNLEFPDCTNPPVEVVKRFLDICDSAGDGRVAVHCLAGLGRTGTLIGVRLIKDFGFGAAAAIGYMRVMRPGSVIGEQQEFLETIAKSQWRDNLPSCRRLSRMLSAIEEAAEEVTGSVAAEKAEQERLTRAEDVQKGQRRRVLHHDPLELTLEDVHQSTSDEEDWCGRRASIPYRDSPEASESNSKPQSPTSLGGKILFSTDGSVAAGASPIDALASLAALDLAARPGGARAPEVTKKV